jgi:hypothetical protein
MGAVEPYNGDTFPLPPMCSKVYEALTDENRCSNCNLRLFVKESIAKKLCISCRPDPYAPNLNAIESFSDNCRGYEEGTRLLYETPAISSDGLRFSHL